VDVSFVIRRRLDEFGLEQRDLAKAARVTDSYISQLLSRKRTPPAPNRTDIYEKMDAFLRLPRGELARLADQERKAQLKKVLGDEPSPLFAEVRDLIIRKCRPGLARTIRAVFEQQPFGELERLITQKLIDLAKGLAQRQLENEPWLRTVAELGGRSYEELRVNVLEFLDTDMFHLSSQTCIAFLDPLIQSWSIDLGTFALDVELSGTIVRGNLRRFEFVEVEAADDSDSGMAAFRQDRTLSATATREEVEFLKRLKPPGRRATALYYYRELQNLRDPIHFESDGR